MQTLHSSFEGMEGIIRIARPITRSGLPQDQKSWVTSREIQAPANVTQGSIIPTTYQSPFQRPWPDGCHEAELIRKSAGIEEQCVWDDWENVFRGRVSMNVAYPNDETGDCAVLIISYFLVIYQCGDCSPCPTWLAMKVVENAKHTSSAWQKQQLKPKVSRSSEI